MQGLADGYFVIPYTLGNYLAEEKPVAANLEAQKESDGSEFKKLVVENCDKIKSIMNSKGKKAPDEIHREFGRVMWDKCGMGRNSEGLKSAINSIQEIRENFSNSISVMGSSSDLNMQLEHAIRTYDFIELGDLMCRDALQREESCGGHFREEYQTAEGEAKRNDRDFCYVSAWQYNAKDGRNDPVLHKEELNFENVQLSERSYK